MSKKSAKPAKPEVDPNLIYRNSEHLYEMMRTALIPSVGPMGSLLLGNPLYPHRSYGDEVVELEARVDVLWKPAGSSLADRNVTLRGPSSVKGATHNPENDRRVQLESTEERDLGDILMANPKVVSVLEQQTRTFRDDDGRMREHTFDFIADVLQNDEIRIIHFAVKAEKHRKSSGVDEVIKKFREQRPAGSTDQYLVRTRENITHDDAYNARQILWARRLRSPDDDTRLADMLATIHGTVQLSAILDLFGSQDDGFVAAVNLLDAGRLTNEDGGRFSHSSNIKVVHGLEAK